MYILNFICQTAFIAYYIAAGCGWLLLGPSQPVGVRSIPSVGFGQWLMHGVGIGNSQNVANID
jgi:hypothetical protein